MIQFFLVALAGIACATDSYGSVCACGGWGGGGTGKARVGIIAICIGSDQ